MNLGLGLGLPRLRRRVASSVPTYYVDPAGSDAALGTSPDLPWQTISRVNAASLQPGDQVLFKRGSTWLEKLVPPTSGANGRYITFGAYGSGAKPIINGQGTRDCVDGKLRNLIKLSNLDLRNALVSCSDFNQGTHLVESVDYSGSLDQNAQNQQTAVVTYNDCTFANASDDGISGHNTATIIANRCTFSGNNQGLNTTVSGLTVVLNDCVFSGNIANDILAAESTTFTANRCLFTNMRPGAFQCLQAWGTLNSCIFDFSGSNQSTQISLAYPGKTLTLNQCTLLSTAVTTMGGITVSNATSIINMNNCLVYRVWRCGFITAGGQINAVNCLFNGLTTKSLTSNTGEVTAAPQMVDPANGNYRLQATSPARNAGAVIGVLLDYAGNPFASPPSIGAYEYQPS